MVLRPSPARVPPAAVRAAAREALDLLARGHRCCTAVGIARAHQLAAGRPVSDADVVKMCAYFARHAVDRRPDWKARATPGYVAWQAWGGDAGRRWACAELASGRVRRNPTLPGPTARLSVYRSGADDAYPKVWAHLVMRGLERTRPRGEDTHHIWLGSLLRCVEYYDAERRAVLMTIVGFGVARDDAERVPLLDATAEMRIDADGRSRWVYSSRMEAIKRGEAGWRQLPKNVGVATNRVPWVYAEYGALYDWLDEAIRTLAPPLGPKEETLVYDIPTADLPAIVRVPARLVGEKRARLT